VEATITTRTRYPFEEQLRFAVSLPQEAEFPLYFRIPAWCAGAELQINGARVDVPLTPGEFARVARTWHDGDAVVLTLPMQPSVRTWENNHHAVSVDYGPLTFSLQIDERLERKDSDATAIGDSRWQAGVDKSQWPSFKIHPASPWNYGLELDPADPTAEFEVVRRDWPGDDFPFTLEGAPLVLRAPARKIAAWTLDRFGLCAPLQDSPAWSDAPRETVTLVPMGAARLRVAALPTVSTSDSAVRWEPPAQPQPPAFPTRASHTFSGDTTDALSDGVLPASSDDAAIPRFTWWPRRGSVEWAEYEFKEPRTLSEAAVYWFDDTGHGQCRVPASWRLLIRDGDAWRPVDVEAAGGVAPDQFNRVKFAAVRTSAVRLEATLREGFSGGILEWEVK
jgi:hypothetical protein